MVAIPRILFADDNDTFLNATADLLEREGFRCVCVRDGASAAEMLHREEFDVLITDIRMPGNDDLELVREVSLGETPLPVIIVTGYPRLETAIDSIQLPVVAYIRKPFEIESLVAEVQNAVARARAARAARIAERRMQECRDDLAAIAKGIDLAPAGRPRDAVDVFLGSAFRNIAGSLIEVRRLAEGLASGVPRDAQVCLLTQCPRETVLRDGILDAIAVLEKTKSSFKSSELGALRRRLLDLVGGGGGAVA